MSELIRYLNQQSEAARAEVLRLEALIAQLNREIGEAQGKLVIAEAQIKAYESVEAALPVVKPRWDADGRAAYQREYYRKNKERIRAQQREAQELRKRLGVL